MGSLLVMLMMGLTPMPSSSINCANREVHVTGGVDEQQQVGDQPR